ncbi:unnamed protein product [Anisakis simplex]|uniref:Possible tRNA binding domain-containing protein n=1 Tax=Anisakis simplex TaxID=6269 RepID=A0A3P6P8S3_ANISI|nr:unnamed protein product [Anisakis simplex]
MNVIQCAILLGIGLQHKTVDDLIKELDIPTNQVLALFNKSIRKMSEYLDGICMQNISNKIFVNNNSSQQVEGASTSGASMQPTAISLEVSVFRFRVYSDLKTKG